MTSSGKNGLTIRTNASPKWDWTKCPEEEAMSKNIIERFINGNIFRFNKSTCLMQLVYSAVLQWRVTLWLYYSDVQYRVKIPLHMERALDFESKGP